MSPFDVFRDIAGGIVRDQGLQMVSQEELLRVANEAFSAGNAVPEQIRFLAKQIVNGQYVLRTRSDSQALHEDREDIRARALRRTLIGITAAALWAQRQHRSHRAR
jgi:hypothetical protein